MLIDKIFYTVTRIIFFVWICFCISSNHLKAEESQKKDELTKILSLPLIIVPVIQDSVIKRYFALQIKIELRNIKLFDEVQRKIPRLVDKIFTDFYKLFAILNYTNKTFSGQEVREKISKLCDIVLGLDTIQSVLIDNFSMHRIERDQWQKKQ